MVWQMRRRAQSKINREAKQEMLFKKQLEIETCSSYQSTAGCYRLFAPAWSWSSWWSWSWPSHWDQGKVEPRCFSSFASQVQSAHLGQTKQSLWIVLLHMCHDRRTSAEPSDSPSPTADWVLTPSHKTSQRWLWLLLWIHAVALVTSACVCVWGETSEEWPESHYSPYLYVSVLYILRYFC